MFNNKKSNAQLSLIQKKGPFIISLLKWVKVTNLYEHTAIPDRGHHQAVFQRSHLTALESVPTTIIKVFAKPGNMQIIFLEYMLSYLNVFCSCFIIHLCKVLHIHTCTLALDKRLSRTSYFHWYAQMLLPP